LYSSARKRDQILCVYKTDLLGYYFTQQLEREKILYLEFTSISHIKDTVSCILKGYLGGHLKKLPYFCLAFWCWFSKDKRAMPWLRWLSCPPGVMEAWIQSKASPFGICDWQGGTGTGFSQCFILWCLYHSINVLILIHLSLTSYDYKNW
jgi:hypothetical protein